VKQREARRDKSWRKARRAQREHLQAVHPSGVVDCPCELSVWMFEKRKPVGCSCRKKKFGQPKLTVGIEYGPSENLAARRRWRFESFRWLRWPGEGDDLWPGG